MKRIVYGLVVCFTLIIVTSITVFSTSGYTIRLGNKVIEMQNPIFMCDDRIYVSVRNLSEALGIPVYWDENKNEVRLDIYNKSIPVSDKTEYKDEGVIPDEETAYVVGKAILEKYAGKSLEYETEDKIYYLKVTYHEYLNAWSITQWFDFKNGGGWAASGVHIPNVIISKSTGEVLSINTYNSLY